MKRARQELADIVAELQRRDPEEPVNDAGVSAGDALELFTYPPTPPPGFVFEPDVPFGRVGEHVLDLQLLRPETPTTPRPAVVFVHGGGLRSGFPEMHTRQASALAAEGYVTASIDYRVYPETHWPGALEDVKCAVRWVRANAVGLGVDPGRIAVVGGSAGGYLAALTALTPGRFEGAGGRPECSSEVQAAVLLYPLTDMLWSDLADDIRAVVADFVGVDDEAVYREASPVTYVTGAAPPFLTLTGDRDREVPVEMVRAFHARLDAVGADNELVVLPGMAHAFDYSLREWDAVYGRISAFLRAKLGETAEVRRPALENA